MPLMDSIASVHPLGTASAAARNSPALNECFLRLPEIPTIVTIITSFELPRQTEKLIHFSKAKLRLDFMIQALFKYLLKVNNQINQGRHNDPTVGDQWRPCRNWIKNKRGRKMADFSGRKHIF
jgi:hypothetical protein